MDKHLDLNGLTRFWQQIQIKVQQLVSAYTSSALDSVKPSHATKTATTGNTGNISLAIKASNVYVIAAWSTSGSHMIVPFTDTSGNWYVKVLNWNGTTYATVNSTSVTVDYVTIPA